MRVTITDPKVVAAVLAAAGHKGEAPAQLVLTGASATTKRKCACGCGNLTARTWAPGHDATHKKRLYDVIRGGGDKAAAARAELTERGWPQPVIRVTTEVTEEAKTA